MLKKKQHNYSAILTSPGATSYEEAPPNSFANPSAEAFKELFWGRSIVDVVVDCAIPC